VKQRQKLFKGINNVCGYDSGLQEVEVEMGGKYMRYEWGLMCVVEYDMSFCGEGIFPELSNIMLVKR